MIHLSIRVTKDQSAALQALRGGFARLLQPLGKAFASGGQEVLGRAVKNRFTGRGPFPVSQNRLGVVTNRLRKSMRSTLPQIDPAGGRVVISMGSNVSYYGPHEFGFRGRVQVKGHTRRNTPGPKTFRGRLTKSSQRAMTDVMRERELSGTRKRGRVNASYVKPHSRRVNMPARRPLGTELKSIQTRLSFFKKFNAVLARILKPKP